MPTEEAICAKQKRGVRYFCVKLLCLFIVSGVLFIVLRTRFNIKGQVYECSLIEDSVQEFSIFSGMRNARAKVAIDRCSL